MKMAELKSIANAMKNKNCVKSNKGEILKIFKYRLGDEVVDIITGFVGIVRGRTDYLTGCNSYGIQSQNLDKEGNPQDWKWFDEHQLNLKKSQKVELNTPTKKGGPVSRDQIAPH